MTINYVNRLNLIDPRLLLIAVRMGKFFGMDVKTSTSKLYSIISDQSISQLDQFGIDPIKVGKCSRFLRQMNPGMTIYESVLRAIVIVGVEALITIRKSIENPTLGVDR